MLDELPSGLTSMNTHDASLAFRASEMPPTPPIFTPIFLLTGR